MMMQFWSPGQSRDITHAPTQYPCAHTSGDAQSLMRTHCLIAGLLEPLHADSAASAATNVTTALADVP
jgi:hypothetical protein